MEIEKSIDLFDAGDEMLSINQITELIDYFEKKQPSVYCGKGVFQQMIVHKNAGASDAEIVKLKKQYKNLIIPNDYISLLKYSNGISFFEYFDNSFLSVNQIIELTDDEMIDNKFLQIATFKEDYFYLKCDGSKFNIYYSAEGIGELTPVNMSLIAFIEASLISGFSYFWLWNSTDYDLY